MSVISSIPKPMPVPGNDGVSGKNPIQLALEINSCRILAVAEQLALCAQASDQLDRIHHLCLSLARGIDYGIANSEVPAQASVLPPVLKLVCKRKNELCLQPAIMVLMISVKNACKLNWFIPKDTEELLTLADEVASNFVTKKEVNTEACNFLATVSTVMSRFYPRYKLGNIIASLEVKAGYETQLVDFHISKDIVFAKEEKIYLFVAMKDNIDTSSCIITPQKVNILLNGKAVERRNLAGMDTAALLPTMVSGYLKYGINLLQVLGQFNGDFIFVIAFMSVRPSSDLPMPLDYEQPVSAALSSDSELIEGPSRVSLNCPISATRIKTPVKGNFCKHYQCFDLTNYLEINSRRPIWRCPSCKNFVCFPDLRVDRKMLKALQEVDEKVSEVIISEDGSWTAASCEKDDSRNRTTANQQEGHELEESPVMLDYPGNVFDLTEEDDEMDTGDRCEPADTKPVVHLNVQAQSVPSNLTPCPTSGSSAELNRHASAHAVNSASPQALLLNSGSAGFNTRPQAQIGGNSGTSTPVLTDAVSPALIRQPDSFQGVKYPMSSTHSPNSAPARSNLQTQEALYSQAIMNNMHSRPRNVTRVPSAIQALGVQRPTTSLQQHSRSTASLPTASGPSPPFQGPIAGSNAQFANSFGSNVERQRHLSPSFVSPLQIQNVASVPPQIRSTSPGVSHSTPSHNMFMPQTLSQPPHLMRSSQLPRTSQLPIHHNQHGVGSRMGISNSSSTVQRVQLTPSQGSHMRHLQTMPLQTQAAPARIPSMHSNFGGTPQAVSRTENLIDLNLEQNWRPTSRMRGALTGEAYSQALNQLSQATQPVPAQTPSPRPSVPAASSMSNLQALMANRRFASELQNQRATSAATASGNVGTQASGSHQG